MELIYTSFFLFPEREIILSLSDYFVFLVCGFAVRVDRNFK